MKKIKIAAAVFSAAAFFGCAKNAALTPEQHNETAFDEKIESLSNIEQSNDMAVILAENENIFLQHYEYGLDGTFCQKIYAEKGLVIKTSSDGANETYFDGVIYTDSEKGRGLYFNYPEKAEEIKNYYEHLIIFEAQGNETIRKSEKTDSGYKIITQYSIPKDDEYYRLTFGIQDGSSITKEYVLDDNYVIRSIKSIYDGNVISKCIISLNAEKCALPDYVDYIKNPKGKTRKIRIIIDDGFEKTEYGYVIPEDCSIILPENMDYREYTDSEYTKPLQDTEAEKNSDMTVYLKKIR